MSKIMIHTFSKNNDEEVRFTAGEFQDKIYLDLRIFYKDQESSEYKPSKKGITLALEFLPELEKGFQKMDAYQMDLRKQAPKGTVA